MVGPLLRILLAIFLLFVNFFKELCKNTDSVNIASNNRTYIGNNNSIDGSINNSINDSYNGNTYNYLIFPIIINMDPKDDNSKFSFKPPP